MSVEELKRALREESQRVDHGRFRVDAQRALAKLREFRLADPHAFVLELLRAAVLFAPARVDVRVDADEVEVSFPAPPLPLPTHRDLLGHALSAAHDVPAQRARLLALGIAGALALKPAWVKVHSGGRTLVVEYPDRVTFVEASEEKVRKDRLVVHVQERLGLGTLGDLLTGSAEETLVRECARFYPLPLSLNGERVDEEPAFAPAVAKVEREHDGAKLLVAVTPAAPGRSTLAFDVLGVRVTEHKLELPLLTVRAWASDDKLRRNASGDDVIETDPRRQQLMKLLLAAEAELVTQLSQATWRDGGEAARRVLTEAVTQRMKRRIWGEVPGPLRTAVEEAAILPGPSGEWVSIAQLRAELREGRALRYSKQRHPAGTYTRPAVYLAPEKPELWQLMPAVARIDVAAEVEARRAAQQAKQRWEAQPVEAAVLPDRAYLARAPIQTARLVGEVGLAGSDGAPHVRLLCQGKLLQHGRVEGLAPWEFHAVVDLKKPLPEAAWARLPLAVDEGELADALHTAALVAIDGALGRATSMTPELRRLAFRAIRACVRLGEVKRVDELRPVLRTVPVFERVGGGWLSLEQLASQRPCRYVGAPRDQEPLGGEVVVVLDDAERELVRRLVRAELKSHEAQLDLEKDIRARLALEHEQPVLPNRQLARVPIEAEGVRGELGIPEQLAGHLELTLLRNGFVLETANLTARFDVAQAVVEAPGLAPNKTWNAAERNDEFDRVLAAVRVAERRVCVPLLGRRGTASFDELPPRARQYLRAFFERELAGVRSAQKLDDVARAAFEAKLFPGLLESLSLADLAATLSTRKALAWFGGPPPVAAPPGTGILCCSEQLARFAADVLGVGLEDAGPELEAMRRRAEFEAREPWGRGLEGWIKPRAAYRHGRLAGEIGFDPAQRDVCQVRVLFGGRLLRSTEVAAVIPSQALLELEAPGFDPADGEAAELAREVEQAIGVGERELVRVALSDPDAPNHRAVLAWAIGGRLDARLPLELSRALLDEPLFPTTGGKVVGANALGPHGVSFVSVAMKGETRSRKPVVVAADRTVRQALNRWYGDSTDVTESLAIELKTRAAREKLPARERIDVPGASFKRALEAAGVEGEVALVPPSDEAGLVRFFESRRPLCALRTELLPAAIEAAVEDPALTPTPEHTGLIRDAAFRNTLELIANTTEQLASEMAGVFGGLSEEERQRWAPALARVALWLADRGRRRHPLLAVPVLQRSDGRAISLAEVLAEQRQEGRVRTSQLQGEPLDPTRWVLLPRPSEVKALEALEVKREDVTAELRLAEEVRTRPRVSDLSVPVESAWREPLREYGVEGEVVLPPEPSGQLIAELYRERQKLEHLELKHPVGGVARLNSDALVPAKGWSKATRNAAFRIARAELEAALERLVARYLRTAERDEVWHAYLRAAIPWRLGHPGELGGVLPQLDPFEALGGLRITVGAVMAEQASRRVVLVAAPDLPPPADRSVLVDSLRTRALLKVLDAEPQDVSPELRRHLDLERTRRERKLQELRFPGKAVVTVPAAAAGLGGELALPLELAQGGSIVLAREGVSIERYALGDLTVAGVIDSPTLPVDAHWRTATVPPALRRAIDEVIDALYGELAARAPALDEALLEPAAEHALAYLRVKGVRGPEQIAGATGVCAALARAPVFVTTGGRRVDLLTIADWVTRFGAVPVMRRGLFKVDGGGALVLRTSSLNADWILALQAAVAPREVTPVQSNEELRELHAEADPDLNTPLGRGLARLRRELRLLRADALGRLGSSELSAVRVRRGGRVRSPIAYDLRRNLVTIDPDNEVIRAALEQAQARPEKIYALLAAIYGTVNRALEEISDSDEVRLTEALLGHLTTNPELLAPKSGEEA